MSTRFIDMTGQKYGEWTVLDYSGGGKWRCECSCGTVKDVVGKTLRYGKSKTCGHSTGVLKDMTGQQIGEWTVIDYAGNAKWNCRCSCGEMREVHGTALRGGHHKTCGHTRIEKLVERNKSGRNKLEGTQIGDWSVLEYLGEHMYRCKCSCGKEKEVDGKNLTRGKSNSCGHNNNKQGIIDITGRKFGGLTPIKYLGNKRWECLCDCGNSTDVATGNLHSGSIKSCGCKQYDRLTKEEMEEAIQNFLDENGEYPYTQDLARILDRHVGNINRYINRFEIRHLINSTFRSIYERDLYELLGIQGVRGDREVLDGMELDLYYPEHKLAIEINGDYWHSTEFKPVNYHQNKTIECARKGIRLIHIFEHQWLDVETQKKIVDMVKNKLGIIENKEINSEECDVTEVSLEESKEFLDKYHIQNTGTSDIRLGCYYNEELVGIMTFKTKALNGEGTYEIIRMAWKTGVNVKNGAEKLFKHFIDKYKPSNVETEVDLTQYTGNIYTRLGFKSSLGSITDPKYFWVKQPENIVYTKNQARKLVIAGTKRNGMTNDEIMESYGYMKIYDSGSLKLNWCK